MKRIADIMSFSKLHLSIAALTELASRFCASLSVQSTSMKDTVHPHTPSTPPQKLVDTLRLRFSPDDIVQLARLSEHLGGDPTQLAQKLSYGKLQLSPNLWVLNGTDLIAWLSQYPYGTHSNALGALLEGSHMRLKVNLLSKDKSSVFTLILLVYNVHLLLR